MAANATYTVWTPAEIEHVRRRMHDGALAPTIAHELGRSVQSVHSKAQHLGLTASAIREARGIGMHAPVITPPSSVSIRTVKPEIDREWQESDDEFLSRVVSATSREVARYHAERFVTLRIESDRPVALSLSSDWHLTSTGATDVAGLLDYADAIREADGCYALAVGDLIDNPIKHAPAAIREIPDDLRLLNLVVGRFGGKLLGTTSGNHDDWAKKYAGVDHLAAMAREHRVHYAPDELVYRLEIVAPGTDRITARYVVATRHKYRRNSSLNALHATSRWLEEMVNDWPHDPATGATYLPDVAAIGDSHQAAVGVESTPRGDVIGVRMGAWQMGSSFSRALGFRRFRPTAPVVILHHARRQLAAHSDYRIALAHLAGLRARKRVRAA